MLACIPLAQARNKCTWWPEEEKMSLKSTIAGSGCGMRSELTKFWSFWLNLLRMEGDNSEQSLLSICYETYDDESEHTDGKLSR
mmetsp:Transcript_16293/g.26376  ORF Transcript_16293/g.26376 Transcript_16293/m.26376 type:complete len:84 (+) Transcript_16293:610-861(+)